MMRGRLQSRARPGENDYHRHPEPPHAAPPRYVIPPLRKIVRPSFRPLWALLIAFSISTPALAYVDPGTGMMLIQGLIAALGAAVFIVGRPFRWLSRKLKSLRRRDEGS